MSHEADPREELLAKVGDTSGVEVFGNDVLVALYMRPEKTKGGVILSSKHLDEDRYQSKIGLIVSVGPSAFQEDDEGKWFGGRKFEVGDWVLFRPSDGWNLTVKGIPCKVFSDTQVKATVNDVDEVW